MNNKGFTLVELMVVVIIVGILASVAVPLYTNYIEKAKQAEAKADIDAILTDAKIQAQERFATTTDTTYTVTSTTAIVSAGNYDVKTVNVTVSKTGAISGSVTVGGTGVADHTWNNGSFN